MLERRERGEKIRQKRLNRGAIGEITVGGKQISKKEEEGTAEVKNALSLASMKRLFFQLPFLLPYSHSFCVCMCTYSHICIILFIYLTDIYMYI